MKLAIMQPYFFPYVGYFSLIDSVDRFVFYDDVNYIKNGWINRNRLLASGKPIYFTVPTINAASSTKIKDIQIDHSGPWKRKLIEMVRHSYGKAPYFDQGFDLFKNVLNSDCCGISELAINSILRVAELLELNTSFVLNSVTYNNHSLKGLERIIDISKKENATEYINLPGGKCLYNNNDFERNNIKLNFVVHESVRYSQFGNEFVEDLSVLDMIMFNSRAVCRALIAGNS